MSRWSTNAVSAAVVFVLCVVFAGGIYGQSADEDGLSGMNMDSLAAMMEMMESMNLSAMMPREVLPGRFESTDLGYSIDIPEGWQGMKVMTALTVFEGGMPQDMMSAAVNAPPTIAVLVDTLMEEGEMDVATMELEEFRRKFIEGRAMGESGEEVADIHEVEKVSFAGAQWVHASLSISPMPDVYYRTEMYITNRNGYQYNLVYSSNSQRFVEFRTFIENHKQSFHFLP